MIIYKGWEILRFTEYHYEVPLDDHYVRFDNLIDAMEWIDKRIEVSEIGTTS